MNLKLYRSFAGLVFLMSAWQVHGAMVVKMEIEVSNKDKTTHNTNIISIDDKKVRIDYLGAEGVKTTTTPYLLTLNEGKSWILGNRDKEEFYCAKIKTEDYFREIGDIVARIESFANMKIFDDKVEVLLEEPGPKILGYTTTHVRIKTTANLKASVLFKKFQFSVSKIDDVWYIKNRKIHPAKKRWIKALTNSGYGGLDKLSGQFHEKITGSILKHEAVMEVKDHKKNKVDTYIRKIKVVSVQELPASQLSQDSFVKPDCKDINDKQLKNTTRTMFKEEKLTL